MRAARCEKRRRGKIWWWWFQGWPNKLLCFGKVWLTLVHGSARNPDLSGIFCFFFDHHQQQQRISLTSLKSQITNFFHRRMLLPFIHMCKKVEEKNKQRDGDERTKISLTQKRQQLRRFLNESSENCLLYHYTKEANNDNRWLCEVDAYKKSGWMVKVIRMKFVRIFTPKDSCLMSKIEKFRN